MAAPAAASWAAWPAAEGRSLILVARTEEEATGSAAGTTIISSTAPATAAALVPHHHLNTRRHSGDSRWRLVPRPAANSQLKQHKSYRLNFTFRKILSCKKNHSYTSLNASQTREFDSFHTGLNDISMHFIMSHKFDISYKQWFRIMSATTDSGIYCKISHNYRLWIFQNFSNYGLWNFFGCIQ
jgi:hypothetical protein